MRHLSKTIFSRQTVRWLFNRILLGGLIIVTVLAVLIVGAGGWLRYSFVRSLPQIDGELRIPGLQHAVTVRRDQHGVPHIEAQNLYDLLKAQGYITAQDRLWEMDMARRIAAGDAAEILGARLLSHDKVERVLAIRATANQMVLRLSTDDRNYLDAYAAGVNAYINEHSHSLPTEFRILHYTPKPWSAVDSVLVSLNLVQLLDQHWAHKLEREAVTARMGLPLSTDLYPTTSSRDRPPISKETTIAVAKHDLFKSSLRQEKADFDGLAELRASDESCAGCVAGSNAWAISGTRTASGKAILSNDMHLEHQIPNVWYECDLNAKEFHVAGVTVPGLPFVVAGHNEHIAWGLTALHGDTQDVYVERVNSSDQYLGMHGWQPIEHSTQLIRVRGDRDVVLQTSRTEHGPVITSLLKREKRILTLKWSAYDPKVTGIPLFNLNSASDWNTFRRSLSGWWGPTLNFLYADDQGHIGYQAAGYIPFRPAGLSSVPIEDQHHESVGFIAFEQLPAAFDPETGVIATANSRVTSDGYPYELTLEWGSPYRNERIWDVLKNRQRLTQSDMLALQTDVHSDIDQILARRLAFAIQHTRGVDARTRQAGEILEAWDGNVTVDSVAANIVAASKGVFWEMLLKPKLGDDWDTYEWDESDLAQENILAQQSRAWLPEQYATWNDFLVATVRLGLEQSEAPTRLNGWRYGREHPVDLEHPIYRAIPWLKSWTGTGVQPQSGDTTTVKQVARTFGPSQRFTIDWGKSDGATENIVMGQSEDPLSRWYRDQWLYWYNGETFVLPFTSRSVAASTSHTLYLVP